MWFDGCYAFLAALYRLQRIDEVKATFLINQAYDLDRDPLIFACVEAPRCARLRPPFQRPCPPINDESPNWGSVKFEEET